MVTPLSSLALAPTMEPGQRALVRAQIGRALLYLVLLGIAAIPAAAAQSRGPLLWLLLLVAIGEASALVCAAAFARGSAQRLPVAVHSLWIGVDVGLFAWLMALTGGSHSSWFPWALVGVSAAAFVVGWRGAAAALGASAALYLVVAVVNEGSSAEVVAAVLWRMVVLAAAGAFGLVALSNARRGLHEMARLRQKTQGQAEELRRAREDLEERSAQLERLSNEVRNFAVTDVLTGLHNRQYLRERIREDLAAVRRARAHQHAEQPPAARSADLGFLVLDLDGFRELNNRHGEVVGDELLRQVASVVEGTVRGQDSVLRWGGDEFLVVLRAVHPSELPDVARRVRRAVAAEELATDVGALKVTCSVGYCPFPLADLGRLDWEDVVSVAESARLLARKGMGDGSVGVVQGTKALDQAGVTLLLSDLEAAAAAGYVRLLTEDRVPHWPVNSLGP
jgi:diguanylate cyclase (GGDEF)-like protein